MPTLVVVRHAKASNPPGVADLSRPLSPRGARDAAAAGRWIREHVAPPGLLLTSPARRTEETTAALLGQWDELPPVVEEERIYEASLGDLIYLVRGLDEQAPVVLVGHNPGLSALVEDLTGEVLELQTSGIAVVEASGSWTDVAPCECALVAVHTARDDGPDDELA
ncbi:phosphohistidine phosphatase [Kineococcus xinjiangensis]|uniref:Phosphohistidine phosphatase n=1 Tax=Kineococcus xinjiangensis TaxID=512762 RepID=A0A2S6ITI6_9ACTN|nr:histidine phosphatase family protein [Kineococcus xinjiangensis]PPK97567.1 phosphohistidine phosphatase [Kineococcus xinjiangensis]